MRIKDKEKKAKPIKKAKLLPIKKWDLVRNYKYYLMTLPALAIYFLFAYLPLPGILLAFKKYTVNGGIFGSPWVGLENFKAFFSGSDVLRVTRNILLINGGNILFGMTASIFCAILINELFSTKLKKLYQNVLFLPTFFSAILVSKLFNLLLDNDYGLFNSILNLFGLDTVMFYDMPWLWIPILIIANIWKSLGNGLIIYLASIITVDKSIYEAAEIDGCSKVQQIFKITLPSIKPVIVLQFLLAVGRIFNGDFLFIYSFIDGNYKLKETLDIVETYLFSNIVGAGSGNTGYVDYGLNTAIGLYQTILGFALIFTINSIVKKVDKENALF